ncbi:carbohydrate-binding domain-containing protein [Bacillus massilinigeriensis]|uniref:carbohydrate-binding domain-containing protein n=1 Tax=Bacillus massilionigeriensis TaxID=1805475 RepID=UPI000ABB2BFE|nr:carbohydrate-binding domain-containing protein [Bacillus massilionigeriensis]
MKRLNSKFIKVTASLMCTSLLFACSNNSESGTTTNSSTAVVKAESLSTIGNKDIASVINEKVKYSDDDFYSDWNHSTFIKLNGSNASFTGDGGVIIDNNIVTIRTSGVYEISGKLNDGQIIVDAEDKGIVRLVLNGVEINSSNNSPIYVKNSEKTIVSLEKGTQNVLSDGKNYAYEKSDEDEPDAALFSKDSLTINGSGKLTVHGIYNNGIASKDELKITGGTIQIDSVDDGLIGRDLLAIKEGNISISAGGDGMKSTNDKDSSKATIAIEGGFFDIASTNDGIQAESSLLIADGDFNITSGGGSPETITVNTNSKMAPGDFGKDSNSGSTDTNSTTATSTETESTKGLKAAVEVGIGGGSFTLNSLDDAVHSNNSITITGGDLKIASGDDGIHADTAILTKGGNININKSYEGVESQSITIADGKIHVNASDDGINIGGGNDQSGMDMEQAESSENGLLSFNGGYVYINSVGDGLDSNGSISMTDGTVIVNGPTDNGNAPLDYGQSFEISGGLLVAAGSSGMAMATSEESKQNSIIMNYPKTQSAGTIIHLEDSKGNSILTFAPEKDYQSVIISSPKLRKDTSYTLYSGGSTTGDDKDGLYSNGNYKGGSKVVSFKVSESVTWLDETGVTEAKTSGPGGMGGMRGQGAPGGDRGDMFSNLDDATREKVKNIMDQQRNGTITQEEAQKQLEALGVDIPLRKDIKQQNQQ